jgi:hypothetical protein
MRKALMLATVSASPAMTAGAWAAEQTGKIISLDPAAKTFICQWGGEDRFYKTTDKTVFRVGTKAGDWSNLKMGDRVNIFYKMANKERIAERVVIEQR